MKILLTSDIQTKNMCAANYEKLYEAIGPVDAVLANGDIIDVPDRGLRLVRRRQFLLPGAPGYLRPGDRRRGIQRRPPAPECPPLCLHRQPRGHGPLQRHHPPEHPVQRPHHPGLTPRTSMTGSTAMTTPPTMSLRRTKRSSSRTTPSIPPPGREVLTLPESDTGDERYYAVTIGDLRVIVLEVARIWRGNSVGSTSKYSEIPGASVDQYGFGQHIFEPIGEGSDQLAFLEEELQSDAFQNAKYKMVMFHWQFHSLGGQPDPRLHRSGGLLRYRPRHRGGDDHLRLPPGPGLPGQLRGAPAGGV